MRLTRRSAAPLVTFYHDIEQDLDSDAHRDSCREVVRAFLALENQYGIHATYNLAARLVADQPDLVEWITRDGHEVAFHSYDHRRDWSPTYYCQQIDLCRTVSGSIPGYRSPRSEIDRPAVERLWERDFLWNAEVDQSDEPYFIYKGLVRLPIAIDDWPLHRGEVRVEQYLQHVSRLFSRRPYVALGFHDSVASAAPRERLQAWERILEMATRAQAVTVTFAEAADLFRRAAIARYYTQTARDWNRDTQRLYRTRRFQEIIESEAARLVNPVVVDLGSGGGVLSRPLQDKAARIYCVDNAPGMVDQVRASDRIQGRLGEATDSTLPVQCADLVICARIIEYLFWPERLADEIRRIGKPGASYVVTFPALRDVPPANEGPPPDRIRRHFTPEDIRRWAAPIGPGRLLGVQYEEAEPHDRESERRYRATEENPPPQVVPMNWVYVGTVAPERASARAPQRVVPLTAVRFRFRGAPSEGLRAVRRMLAGWLPPRLRTWVSRMRARTTR